MNNLHNWLEEVMQEKYLETFKYLYVCQHSECKCRHFVSYTGINLWYDKNGDAYCNEAPECKTKNISVDQMYNGQQLWVNEEFGQFIDFDSSYFYFAMEDLSLLKLSLNQIISLRKV